MMDISKLIVKFNDFADDYDRSINEAIKITKYEIYQRHS